MRQVLTAPARSPYPFAKARTQKGSNRKEPDLTLATCHQASIQGASFQQVSLTFKSTLKDLKTALDPEVVKSLNKTFTVKGKALRQLDLLELIQSLSQENRWSPKQNLKRLGFATLYTSWVATLGIGYVATHLVMDMLSISGETLQHESAKTFFQGARLEHLKELLTDTNTQDYSPEYTQQLSQLEKAGLIKTVKKHRVWRSSETLGYTLTNKGKTYLSQLRTKDYPP
ncbi:MAG: hypothetical protein K2X66_05120, partial [Cyanobacteria bacterium]|nr:hypothetical protein [Cyanobacteriota bacterium]